MITKEQLQSEIESLETKLSQFKKQLEDYDVKNVLELSRDERIRLANDSKTSPETLKVLATDGDSYVRYWVATNPSTPPEVLKILATDEDSGVRYCTATNPNCPQVIRDFINF